MISCSHQKDQFHSPTKLTDERGKKPTSQYQLKKLDWYGRFNWSADECLRFHGAVVTDILVANKLKLKSQAANQHGGKQCTGIWARSGALYGRRAEVNLTDYFLE